MQLLSIDSYGMKTMHCEYVHLGNGMQSDAFNLIVTDNHTRVYSAKTLRVDYSIFDATRRYADGLFFPIHFHPDIMSRALEDTACRKSRGGQQRKMINFVRWKLRRDALQPKGHDGAVSYSYTLGYC
jgi:hypothetical protein